MKNNKKRLLTSLVGSVATLAVAFPVAAQINTQASPTSTATQTETVATSQETPKEQIVKEYSNRQLEDVTEEEKKLCSEVVAELGKYFRVVSEAEELDKIANDFGSFSERPKIKYDVKIVVPNPEYKDAEEMNAFSIPGGIIYVTKGLYDKAKPKEIEGILGHEVGHSEKMHTLKFIKASKKLHKRGFFATIGMAVLFGNESIPYTALASELVVTALLNEGYNQKFELEADMRAIDLCIKAGRNPVGMLTFLEYCKALEDRKPEIDLGIFRTHPVTEDRIKNVVNELKQKEINILRREVTHSLEAQVADYSKIMLNGEYIFAPVAKANGKDGKERAEEYVLTFNKLLIEDLRIFEISSAIKSIENTSYREAVFYARGRPFLKITEEDAQFYSKSLENMVDETKATFRKVFFDEQVRLTSGIR